MENVLLVLYSRNLQGSNPGKLLQVLATFYIKGSIDPIQPIFDKILYYYREFHLFILQYYMNFNYISYTLTDIFGKKSIIGTLVHIFCT